MKSDRYSNLVHSEVVTEGAVKLGWVRSVKCHSIHSSLILAPVNRSWLPDVVISTYELSTDEIVSIGSSRVIVCEGAEGRLKQLHVGILDRFGFTYLLQQDIRNDGYILRRNRFLDDDDRFGGVAPSTRPRRPNPNPKTGDSTVDP
ncbi:hypothetical protein V2H45_01525 [Tumidithrix elongata RA019]|uniref:PRC-barrel domain-containing protein n=1 Tax=Tumidithrix elongata BACA0141 TaxID=2716417 RepID=A0AAW9PW21_9CYAN|nr:hypothetical protein [Tumidithrix elongata RA019]